MTEVIEIEHSNNQKGKTAIRIVRSNTARRLSLRIDPHLGIAKIIAPKRVSLKKMRAFVNDKITWILDELANLPPQKFLIHNHEVPILGVPHTIVHCPEARRGVWCEDNNIYVSGLSEHVERRVHDWLKFKAKSTITPLAMCYAAIINENINGITIKSTKSRWGSCSSTGRISFTWHLIMTPEKVLKYVIAHEVCHLKEFNHSEGFWTLVENTFGKSEAEKMWLKKMDHICIDMCINKN